MRAIVGLLFLVAVCLVLVSSGTSTPQFGREYGLQCANCHSHVPKLNAFGERFLSNGFSLPELRKRPAIPASLWVSGLAQNPTSSSTRFTVIPNRVELISGGRDDRRSLSYFVEWRMASREVLADGSTRDRSGRFEDLFVTADLGSGIWAQVGQFRQLSQIDVSRRLSLSEPVALSASLSGEPHPDARIASLRGFSLSGRSPAVRLGAERGGWHYGLSVPFPGEFSLPLTEEASRTASNEFESEPKGMFVEVYRRGASSSLGLHAFWGSNRRSLVGAAVQVPLGRLSLEGGVSHARAAGADEWRHSVWLDYVASFRSAFGVRWDHRHVASQSPAVVPYASLAWEKEGRLLKLLGEVRLQKGELPRYAVELSWMF